MKYTFRYGKKITLIHKICAGALVLLGIWLARPLLFEILTFVAYPFWKGQETLSDIHTQEIQSRLHSRHYLAMSNESLKKTIDKLELELIRLRALEVENRQLRTIIGIQEETSHLVPATVYVKPPVSPYDSYVIRSSSSTKLTVGDLVYAHEDILIGKIVRSYDDFGVVELFTLPKTRTDAILEDGTPLVLIGQGGGNFVAYVPRDVEVLAGQVIRTTIGGSQVVLGIVEDVEDSSAESFKTIFVRVPQNIYTTSLVLIGPYEEQ